jgi:hypothetical protein
VHSLITLFLEVILLVIILLLIGLVVLVVLVFATRVIVASIVLMTTIMSLAIPIVSDALLIVAVLAMMLPVAQFTAASNVKMSHLLLFWLFFLLDLVKDADHFIVSLTLLKKGDEPSGSMVTVLFVSPQTGCVKKICSLFSCAVGKSIV